MIHMSNKEQIQTLMEEISAQQSIIHQTSQALNLVAANGDALKGTEQEIEAERLLAIATQRRLACLSEIQRLKHHSAAQSENSRAAKTCKGSLTINDIRLPLKTEYIFTMGSKQDRQIHHFFVLVRNGSHVLASHLLSTHDGLSGDCLPFTNMMTMNDIGSDFLLDIEVYSMQTKKPDVKEKKGNLLKTITPRRGSKKGNMMSPGVSSPGGPGAVRTSSFILVGGTRVALSNVKNTKFNLSKVPFLCPLEGSIHMKVKCYIETKVEERGFLTMFDDVNGFGAWHRRWCVLSNGYVSYWKYPDDERRKAPIGSISLKECSTQNVTTVAREYCARPNTVELVTRRQSRDSDENNLIVTCFGDYTEIKWWMSADTKEERQQWVNKLNKALVNMRQWSRDSTRSQRK
uniref:Actin-binding protein anillin-like n=1 Tax=Saccoglossus kowalevskii TaxID=10224 RepID=A0ABM0MAA2_SACKO|nr:PREDICTED: actin-binding protein anillin-like [Saccoglossus kowalevskii]